LYRAMGRYPEAEPLLVRSLSIREQQLGADHPNTAQSLNNLAVLYYAMGRYPEAEPLFVRSLSISEQQLGADHPDTAQGLNNLAVLYYAIMGRYPEAEPLYLRALKIFFNRLGKDHPNTQGVWKNFINFLQEAISTGQDSQLSQHPTTQAMLQQLRERE
ncbi:tetratricopeptide repeat-containing protein, partial [Microcoleus sp. N9_B4]|uniref:tetratricopeptide repeat-containing protein n=1 Tax=Microcoleus sp. N9_B4 TaxID=3055386 RepID=UPI002FCF9580